MPFSVFLRPVMSVYSVTHPVVMHFVWVLLTRTIYCRITLSKILYITVCKGCKYIVYCTLIEVYIHMLQYMYVYNITVKS